MAEKIRRATRSMKKNLNYGEEEFSQKFQKVKMSQQKTHSIMIPLLISSESSSFSFKMNLRVPKTTLAAHSYMSICINGSKTFTKMLIG